MADKTGKPWMDVGETDDPTAVIETFTAGAVVTKGDPVYLSADDQVTGAVAAKDCIGVATKNAENGKPCPVLVRGRVKVTAGGAITRGQAVFGADADGKVLALADQAVDEGGTATYIIVYSRKFGKALQTASAKNDLIFISVGA